jgi:murein DD-endopeptidase MepM/ murein hydrolase activator NlpD
MRYSIIAILCFALIIGCNSRKELNYWQRIDLVPGDNQPHILSLRAKGSQILVGTYGQGAFYSNDSGKHWRQFKSNPANDSTGLGWDYIIGGDWKRDQFVLATLGDGINVSNNGGETWKRFGYNYFGVEYLYAVGAEIQDGIKYIPTADGIVIYERELDDSSKGRGKPFQVITEDQGLASQYIYDLLVEGRYLYAGSLHGFSYSRDYGNSWRNYSPNGKTNSDGQALCKVRAVAIDGKRWYAGCDDGLFITSDGGKNWANISAGLPSNFIHDILIDKHKIIWVATYKGISKSVDSGQTYITYGKESCFLGENINCLAQLPDGSILAGTNYGLYRQTETEPPPNTYPPAQAVFDKPDTPIHQRLIRPISANDNDQKDQTYLYGCTMNGNFRQHQGCEFNNPEGVPLRAVDSGVIVFTEPEIGHTVLKCDTRYEDYYVYAHYHHQVDIVKRVGDRVAKGDIIGHVGKLGDVTNEHLHFELAISKTDDTNVPDKTVNSELWTAPLSGCGTIVGNVVDVQDKPIPKIKIFGVEKPVPTETPFSYAESYGDSVNPSPAYGEKFVIADVPSGNYLIWVERDSTKFAVNVTVETGKVTRAKIVVGK